MEKEIVITTQEELEELLDLLTLGEDCSILNANRSLCDEIKTLGIKTLAEREWNKIQHGNNAVVTLRPTWNSMILTRKSGRIMVEVTFTGTYKDKFTEIATRHFAAT